MEEQLPDDEDDFQPPKKKHKHRYQALAENSNEAKRAQRRFDSPVSGEELGKAPERSILGNTGKTTNWAQKVFVEWLGARNKRALDRNGSSSTEIGKWYLLDAGYDEELCKRISLFLLEAHRKDGEKILPPPLFTPYLAVCSTPPDFAQPVKSYTYVEFDSKNNQGGRAHLKWQTSE